MGVQSLWDIVGPSARPVRLEALSRKKLAVDASIWIYQFLKAVRDKEGNALHSSHIVGFFRRICKLLYFGILPIFVFDGGVPVLKRQTILERKNRRQEKSESTRETAQKLLAIQLQREAEGAVRRDRILPSSNRRNHNHNGNFGDDNDNDNENDNDDDDDDVIYFEDLPANKQTEVKTPPKRPRTIQFRRKDEYHLPDLHEFKVSKNDQRIMLDDETIQADEDFDHVDGININDVDPKSKEFARDLPIATQYMILNHLRLKSRLRMGYRKEQLQELFPSSMEFSKFQIQQVQKRNFFTQKLMNVTGMGDDFNVERRIAGDKDRKYALVKNEDGWTLALSGQGSSIENPVALSDGEEEEEHEAAKQRLRPPGRAEKVQPTDVVNISENSDSDFEDVPLEEEKETQEERDLQQALIRSIYDQYEHQQPNKEEDSAVAEKEKQNRGLFDLAKALEESKKDYYRLVEDEKQLMKTAPTNHQGSIGLGQSFLFPGLNFESKPSEISATEAPNTNKEPASRDKLRSSFPAPDHTQKTLKSDAGNKHSTNLPLKSDLGSSFLFSNDNHRTGRVELKRENKRRGSHPPPQDKMEDSTPAVPVAPTEGLSNQISKSVTTETARVHQPDKRIRYSSSAEEEEQEEEEEEEEENDNNEKEEINQTKCQQQIPDWFRNEVNQTLNPHNEKFVSNTIYNQSKPKEEEEAMGLIPWFEAKEYLEQQESEHSDDGVVEIGSPVHASPIHPTVVDKPVPPLNDDSAQKQQSTEDLSTDVSRKAAVIDYEYEENEEEDLFNQLRAEEADSEKLQTQIRQSHVLPVSSVETRITEEHLLQEKLQKAKRDSDEVTENMIYDVQELLKRFGIPFITAPMEAEAQCAELLKIGLVDGIITDDSDCFLFGGDKVYKNMFNQKQFVECYFKDDIDAKLGLSQDSLIELALLLGSDYTEGIKGIGPVLAMEILAEFGNLTKFKQWFDKHTKAATGDKRNLTSLEKNLLTRTKNGKLYLPDSFPDKVVFEAYKQPQVDHDKSEFKWGVPNLDQIRSFLMYNVGWTQERVDEVMIPLIRDLNKKRAEGTQSTIGEFFPQEYIQSRKELHLGKRMKTAANKLHKRKKLN
ncbi:uncharacterized protein LODBEIA_P51420 [Lodderomyces beijingensis]|uniref:DNA repair protein RAD2 n=1 Tax=Lodderomyces beijingensis TaxID=1775926 RepID=A0ABP0ZRZ0_9ASCO